MKKIFYLLATITLLTTSCSETDETEEFENIGTVVGTWGFGSVTADVETSGSSLSTIINPLLEVALQSYAGGQEPTYYVFDEDGSFETYVIQDEQEVQTGSGTYILGETTLTLTYSETSTTETLQVLVANDATLKIKKDYSNSVVYWGADIIGQYTGVTINSATTTLSYAKQ